MWLSIGGRILVLSYLHKRAPESDFRIDRYRCPCVCVHTRKIKLGDIESIKCTICPFPNKVKVIWMKLAPNLNPVWLRKSSLKSNSIEFEINRFYDV